MFTLLLLPPACGLFLFFGLLSAPRGPLVRVLLSLVLAGLVVPAVVVVVVRMVGDEAPWYAGLSITTLVATLFWRALPLLPTPRQQVRAICWMLVLLSCTLTTVALTAPSLPAHGLLGALVLGYLPFLVAHLALSLLGRRVQGLVNSPASSSVVPRPGRPASQPTIPLLSRPLELVGADAPYRPLAAALCAGPGPAAAFSSN